jgi:hypothetical protein
MANSYVHKASDLVREERMLVERWLGRPLSDDETVSLNVYRPHRAPTGFEREALRKDILSQAREIGSRAQPLSETDAAGLIDEAIEASRRKPA